MRRRAGIAAAATALAAASVAVAARRRARPRPRRPPGPPDPALAVRVGGGGRPRHLVRRASPSCGRARGSRTRREAPCSARPAVLEVVCGAVGVAAFARDRLRRASPARRRRPRTSSRRSSTSCSGSASRSRAPSSATSSPPSTRGARSRARVSWVAGRARGGRLPAPMAYPEWLGRWPAAVGILAFAWVELVYANKDDPSILATLALLYAATQLIGHERLRHRHVDAPGRRLRRLLQPLLEARAAALARPHALQPAAAVRRARTSTSCRARSRCSA